MYAYQVPGEDVWVCLFAVSHYPVDVKHREENRPEEFPLVGLYGNLSGHSYTGPTKVIVRGVYLQVLSNDAYNIVVKDLNGRVRRPSGDPWKTYYVPCSMYEVYFPGLTITRGVGRTVLSNVSKERYPVAFLNTALEICLGGEFSGPLLPTGCNLPINPVTNTVVAVVKDYGAHYQYGPVPSNYKVRNEYKTYNTRPYLVPATNDYIAAAEPYSLIRAAQMEYRFKKWVANALKPIVDEINAIRRLGVNALEYVPEDLQDLLHYFYPNLEYGPILPPKPKPVVKPVPKPTPKPISPKSKPSFKLPTPTQITQVKPTTQTTTNQATTTSTTSQPSTQTTTQPTTPIGPPAGPALIVPQPNAKLSFAVSRSVARSGENVSFVVSGSPASYFENKTAYIKGSHDGKAFSKAIGPMKGGLAKWNVDLTDDYIGSWLLHAEVEDVKSESLHFLVKPKEVAYTPPVAPPTEYTVQQAPPPEQVVETAPKEETTPKKEVTPKETMTSEITKAGIGTFPWWAIALALLAGLTLGSGEKREVVVVEPGAKPAIRKKGGKNERLGHSIKRR